MLVSVGNEVGQVKFHYESNNLATFMLKAKLNYCKNLFGWILFLTVWHVRKQELMSKGHGRFRLLVQLFLFGRYTFQTLITGILVPHSENSDYY